eukprot:scaffold42764_cov60-Attheya_sp.AAC.2
MIITVVVVASEYCLQRKRTVPSCGRSQAVAKRESKGEIDQCIPPCATENVSQIIDFPPPWVEQDEQWQGVYRVALPH